MTSFRRTLVAALLATACLLALPTAGRADLAVTVNTSALPGGYTYAIDYQFALGGPSTSNTATVYGLGYSTTGSAGDLSTLQTTGSVTGSLQSLPITLSGTGGGFAEFTQNFTPGTSLTFDLAMTNYAQLSGGTDTFTFGILYYDTNANAFLNIATSNSNNNSFLEVDTNPNGPVTYIASASTNSTFNVSAPTVHVIGVPEPTALWQLLIGLPCLIVFIRCRW